MLVTGDYHGSLPQTEVDAERMKEMFEQFEYDIHQLMNEEATLCNIKQLVHQVTKYLSKYNAADRNPDGSTKAIIFAFSGHGTDDNQLKTNDEKLINLCDIVEPLVNPKLAVVDLIPKFFFIDACRGRVRNDMTGLLAIKGNYCVEFSTLQSYDAGALNTESEWMPVLAERLMGDDDTYFNVMASIRRQVSIEGQQPQTIDNLTTGIFKLYHYSGGESESYVCMCPCAYSGTSL